MRASDFFLLGILHAAPTARVTGRDLAGPLGNAKLAGARYVRALLET